MKDRLYCAVLQQFLYLIWGGGCKEGERERERERERGRERERESMIPLMKIHQGILVQLLAFLKIDEVEAI